MSASSVNEDQIWTAIHDEVKVMLDWVTGAVGVSPRGAAGSPTLPELSEALMTGEALFRKVEGLLDQQILNSMEERKQLEKLQQRMAVAQEAAELREQLDKKDARYKEYIEILDRARGSLQTRAEQVRRLHAEQQDAVWRRIEEREKKFQHSATQVGVVISILVACVTIAEFLRALHVI